MEAKTQINNYLVRVAETTNKLNRDEINALAHEIYETYKNDKNIFIFGNGGSASTSSHLACDLNKGISYGKHKKFHAHSLTDNIATITAYSNDLSYDDVFIEQLKNFLNQGDLVIAISGSGNSKNIIKAVEYANSMGNRTAGLTGYDGGKLKQIATLSVNANVNDMEISEDIHLILCHTIKNVFMNLLKDEK
ncbi:MAG: SIS domain-containing protein [Candidatus Pacebacteria bacterium]|jgi:D-sedoheptulose 7-phosphate isomerase|nr:SIS domain-containing protein [Candidatus Paceibacterota bacterium]